MHAYRITNKLYSKEGRQNKKIRSAKIYYSFDFKQHISELNSRSFSIEIISKYIVWNWCFKRYSIVFIPRLIVFIPRITVFIPRIIVFIPSVCNTSKI